jgi:hypothetical protein
VTLSPAGVLSGTATTASSCGSRLPSAAARP